MIQSAGVAIVDLRTNDPGSEPHVLCVRAYANWDFPKGQLEEDETLVQAAIREVQEEVTLYHGSDYILTGTPAGATTYGKGSRQKTATYYIGLAMPAIAEPFCPVNPEIGKPENDEWRWVPISQLKDLMPPRLTAICARIEGWTESTSQGGADE